MTTRMTNAIMITRIIMRTNTAMITDTAMIMDTLAMPTACRLKASTFEWA